MSRLPESLLSDTSAIGHLPHSKCRNCKEDLRLYQGRWYHITMSGGVYFQPHYVRCSRAYPMRCVKCDARLDYKRLDPSYYDFQCQNCIEAWHKGDKIGNITDELRKQLESGGHRYLKYGTSCSVVLTKNGIFFEDIC